MNPSFSVRLVAFAESLIDAIESDADAEYKRAEDAGDRKQAAYARRVASETLTETITGITSRTGAGYWRYY